MDSKKNIDPEIVELLSETNEMLADFTIQEANGVTEHTTTVRSGLPAATWRKLNYGVQPSKSQTKQIKDSMGMLEAWSEVDQKLAELNGWSASWRLSEDAAFLEAMSQEMQRALIYGDNTKDPEKIMGLAPRFSTGIKSKAENAINVIDAGGTGTDLTSIWLVCWSPRTVFCTFPKGSAAGLKSVDKGLVTKTFEDGSLLDVLRTKYSWDLGLVVRDWRYVVRIANVSAAMLNADPTVDGTCDLDDVLSEAIDRLPNLNAGRLAFYMNRRVKSCLRKQFKNAKNVRYGLAEVAGKDVDRYDGIPIRIVDALAFGESKVAFK
jgi:hypothetical protein